MTAEPVCAGDAPVLADLGEGRHNFTAPLQEGAVSGEDRS